MVRFTIVNCLPALSAGLAADLLLPLLSICLAPAAQCPACLTAESYDLAFSTYLGGSNWEHARDIAADAQGNIYVVGGTASTDFPTTPGAYQRALRTGGSQDFGPCDVFVAKFSPGGALIWSTYIGGPNYDRASAVRIRVNPCLKGAKTTDFTDLRFFYR